MSNSKHPRWGEIYYCDLGKSKGSVQPKIRLVLIIQNDIGNENGPTTVVAAISSGAPDMGNDLVVKVHYALGSRKY